MRFGGIANLWEALKCIKFLKCQEHLEQLILYQIDFDSKGNMYFVGIHSPALWFGNITQLKNGTSIGITKIPMPTGGFNGIESNQISTGSIAVDKKRNVVWASMLSFATKGEILRYNITQKRLILLFSPNN